MLVRLTAAICGAMILFACWWVGLARAEVRAVHVFIIDRNTDSKTVVGAASMYNPFQPGYREGGKETATGERYNPSTWTAAIQTALRERFGGVRQGKRASYALVEGSNKKAIVKINDIGPLKPGRVIDFNEQTMRYFDPTLRLGVIQNVKVTPLPGDDWTPGPVAQR
jgi:rare lipoprotein A